MSEYFRKPIVKTLMLKGKDAVSISNIEKKSTSGLTDTYEITLTNGTKKSFNVNNGKGIKSIAKTSTSGLVDTYTTTYNDGTTTTFTVKNGEKGDTGSVENLEVGGRNLLTGTNNGIDKWDYGVENGSIIKSSKIFDDIGNVNGARFDISVAKKGWGFLRYNDENVKNMLSHSLGKKFSISFDFKSDVSNNTALSIIDNDGSNKMIEFGNFDFVANEWKHVELTGTVVNANLSNQYIYIYLQNLLESAKYVEIANLKLERGEIATDWTPSLEDIENTYATKNEVTKNTNDISSITSKVNAMNNVSSINTVANMLSAGTSASLGSNYQKTIYNIVVHNVNENSSILFTIFGASIGAYDESEFDIVNPAGASTLNGMCDVRITMSNGTPSAQLIRVFDLNGNDNTNSYRMSIYGIQIG